MPIKNREWCIQQVLEGIKNIDYPSQRIKLVFIDNYSTDATFEILSRWKIINEGLYYGVTLLKEQGNIPHLRNICVMHLEGKYMLFWDSDIVPSRDLPKQMIEMMERDDGIGVIEPNYTSLRLEELKSKNLLSRSDSNQMVCKATHATGMGFTLIRREVFEKIGGFNELLEVGEDTEFSIRVFEKTSYRIIRVSKTVFHLESEYKDKFIVRPHQGFSTWLRYNFNERGKHYAESFSKLPVYLRFRILYYVFLPLILVCLPLLLYYMGLFLTLLILVCYLLPGLSLAIYNWNIRKGILSFFRFNIPTGLALSYGTLTYMLKKLLK
jgi:glycosyltransferase involved in cell wall biosynthesis